MNSLHLNALRERINALDKDIVNLLNQRAQISIEVGQHKQKTGDPIFKPARENQVLQHIMEMNTGSLPNEHLSSIYREIIGSSRSLQSPEHFAFLGPKGTFSHLAGLKFLGHSAQALPKSNLEDVFRAVAHGEAELGIIPLENSLEGTVSQSIDLFLQHQVYIHAETSMRISHTLMSLAKELSAITHVYSHAQALGQCSAWLQTNLPHAEKIPATSTAAAANFAMNNEAHAVIGHSLLAEMFHLNILAEHTEDFSDNWTRFLIISNTQATTEAHDKTSILFTTPDRPGALAKILELLAQNRVNMSKLESRPFRSEKWKYVFFADLECNLTQAEFTPLVHELQNCCHTLRILGAYPADPQLSKR